MLNYRDLIFHMFTYDPEIIKVLGVMTSYFCILCTFDFTSINMLAMTNTLGYYRGTLLVYFVCYYFWVIPMAYLLSRNHGLEGIWIAFGSGCAFIMTSLLTILLRCDLAAQ